MFFCKFLWISEKQAPYEDEVSLHQSWTNTAILLTFICDLLGGGDLTRITLCVTILADILPPEKL